MPAWGELNGKQYRIALVGVDHGDERLVEWLEGPNHEVQQYISADRITTGVDPRCVQN